MGYSSAVGMRSEATRQGHPESEILRWHLQHNHYPPHPAFMVTVAERVLRYARRGQFDRRVRMPDGVQFRGQTTGRVGDLVESLHLDAFLEEVE